jgi:hypothetical protein
MQLVPLQYGHGIPLEEWALQDPTEQEGWENDEPVLDHHGKPILKEPRKFGAGLRNGLGAAAGTLVVRGAMAVHGLLNVLLEASGGDPGGAESMQRDAPHILAPVPFANATLRRATLKLARSQAASTATVGGCTSSRIQLPRSLKAPGFTTLEPMQQPLSLCR